MKNIYILKTKDREVNYDYFLDSDKGIMIDLSKCINNNLKLSDVRYLCDNVTSLNKKNDFYYINDCKYLEIGEVNKFIDCVFNELSSGILKEREYLCLEHHGKYSDRYKSYKKLLDEIDLKNYKIFGIPVEQYIKGNWNECDENSFITNIMIPIKKIKV